MENLTPTILTLSEIVTRLRDGWLLDYYEFGAYQLFSITCLKPIQEVMLTSDQFRVLRRTFPNKLICIRTQRDSKGGELFTWVWRKNPVQL